MPCGVMCFMAIALHVKVAMGGRRLSIEYGLAALQSKARADDRQRFCYTMPSACNGSPLDGRSRFLAPGPGRRSDPGRPRIAAHAKPRLLLVLADPEGDPGGQARRYRGGAP